MLWNGSKVDQPRYLVVSDLPIKWGDLVKGLSKQSAEVVFWFLFTAYSEVRDNEDELKKGLLKGRLKLVVLKILIVFIWHTMLKKWLLRKDEIQSIAKKTWSKGEAKGM